MAAHAADVGAGRWTPIKRQLIVTTNRYLPAEFGLGQMANAPQNVTDSASHKRRMEIYAFLIVTALLMPFLAVATVGTWGLTVWIYQAINGSPGPPSK